MRFSRLLRVASYWNVLTLRLDRGCPSDTTYVYCWKGGKAFYEANPDAAQLLRRLAGRHANRRPALQAPVQAAPAALPAPERQAPAAAAARAPAEDRAAVARVLEPIAYRGEALIAEVVYADGSRWWSLSCRDACCPEEGTPYEVGTHPLAAEAVYAGMQRRDDRAELEALVAGPEAEEDEGWWTGAEAVLSELERSSRRGRQPGFR